MNKNSRLKIIVTIFSFFLILCSNNITGDIIPAYSAGQAKLKVTGKIVINRKEKTLNSTLILSYKGRPVLGAMLKVEGYSLTDNGEGLYTGERADYTLNKDKTLKITMNYYIRRDNSSPMGEITLAWYKVAEKVKKEDKRIFKMSGDTAIGSEVRLIVK